MMEFIPALVSGGVVLNAVEICDHGPDCRTCPELAVGVHNWLVATNLKYLVVDFQDEKDVCPSILIELLQLRKRMHFPFLFVGLMDRPKALLKSYAYSGYPFFATPEEAFLHLKQMHGYLLTGDLSRIGFSTPVPCNRNRVNRGEIEEAVPAEAGQSGAP